MRSCECFGSSKAQTLETISKSCIAITSRQIEISEWPFASTREGSHTSTTAR